MSCSTPLPPCPAGADACWAWLGLLRVRLQRCGFFAKGQLKGDSRCKRLECTGRATFTSEQPKLDAQRVSSQARPRRAQLQKCPQKNNPNPVQHNRGCTHALNKNALEELPCGVGQPLAGRHATRCASAPPSHVCAGPHRHAPLGCHTVRPPLTPLASNNCGPHWRLRHDGRNTQWLPVPPSPCTTLRTAARPLMPSDAI